MFSFGLNKETSENVADTTFNQWAYINERWCLIQIPQSKHKKWYFLVKNVTTHGTIFFNSLPIAKENMQKHLGLLLHTKLNFLTRINKKIKKANNGISVIKKFNMSLPRSLLITIYKSIARPRLDI